MAFHWLARHPLAMYEFRYVDTRTGKWVRARHKASIDQLTARYDRWEVIGPPEIRNPAPTHGFTPFKEKVKQPLDVAPVLDERERFLAQVFLRRHVTWCARRGRSAQMEGAARLFADC